MTTATPLSELTLLAPAKLNLFLHITGQLPNGYHQLQTLFQLIDYGDTLHFTRLPGPTIELQPAIPGVAKEENLIYRAAQLLQKTTNTPQGVAIHCDKILPMGGGLGGGSSNAATTLLALNQLWQLHLPIEQLAELGKQLGADVPVFVHGHTAWAEGIGEQLTPLEMPEKWFLVIKPPCHVPTAEIFSHQDLTRNTHPIKIRAFLEQGGHNDCQPVAEKLFPVIGEVRNWLAQFALAKMTGTGACVFAQFDTKGQCQAVAQQVPSRWQHFIACGINHSPALPIG